jgi:hypothetical protein
MLSLSEEKYLAQFKGSVIHVIIQCTKNDHVQRESKSLHITYLPGLMFTCGSFNVAVGRTDYTASNNRTINE